jgi:hypothetical protein
MLTFAPPSGSPSLTAWIGAMAAPLAAWFAPPPAAPATVPDHARAGDAAASDATDATALRDHMAHRRHGGVHASYWPCERLNAFLLQMAAHGHCVNAAMMLGHRPYAEQQLAKALSLQDDGLRALAAELRAYFDAPPEVAALQLGADDAGAEPAMRGATH